MHFSFKIYFVNSLIVSVPLFASFDAWPIIFFLFSCLVVCLVIWLFFGCCLAC